MLDAGWYLLTYLPGLPMEQQKQLIQLLPHHRELPIYSGFLSFLLPTYLPMAIWQYYNITSNQ
jgi:hypothetical protein